MKRTYAAIFVLAGAVRALCADPAKQVIFIPGDIKWVEGPASLPKGAQMAILEGDPTKEAAFVIRIKMPDGFRIMPHTHPKDERVTVITGTLYLGMGETFDEKAAKAMPVGSYGCTD